MKRFIFLLVALMPVLVFAQKAKIDFTSKPVFIPFHPMFLNISLLSFTFCTSVRAKIHLVLHFSPGLFTVQIFSL